MLDGKVKYFKQKCTKNITLVSGLEERDEAIDWE